MSNVTEEQAQVELPPSQAEKGKAIKKSDGLHSFEPYEIGYLNVL